MQCRRPGSEEVPDSQAVREQDTCKPGLHMKHKQGSRQASDGSQRGIRSGALITRALKAEWSAGAPNTQRCLLGGSEVSVSVSAGPATKLHEAVILQTVAI